MKRIIFTCLIQISVAGYLSAQEATNHAKDTLQQEKESVVRKDSLRQKLSDTPLKNIRFDKKYTDKRMGNYKFSFATSYAMGKEKSFKPNKDITLNKFNITQKPKVDFTLKPIQQQICFFAIYDCAPIPTYLLNTTPELQPFRDKYAYEIRTVGYSKNPWEYNGDHPACLFIFVRKNKHLKRWGWYDMEPTVGNTSQHRH